MESFEIDFDRQGRLGFPEVIYGASKSVEVLVEILHAYRKHGLNALITKLQPKKLETLARYFPQAIVHYESGIFLFELVEEKLQDGQVAVVSAGTSDDFVALEAYYTLAYLGIKANLIQDIGVAGIHRLFNRLEELQQYKILIVIAGFEGALPTVMGGLLPQPIIAVPTSIGYGVATAGKAALSSMLSSCANGITVVNIDNGYGAAIAAYRILKQIQS